MNLCAHRYHVQHSIASNHKCCGICQIDLFVNVNSLLDLSASSDIHPTSLSNLVAIIHKPPGQLVQTLINPTSEPKILLLFPFTMAPPLYIIARIATFGSYHITTREKLTMYMEKANKIL